MSSTNPRPPLEEMTLRQLRRVASELEISRYSRMRKDELLDSIRQKLPTTGLTESETAPETANVPATEPATRPLGAPVAATAGISSPSRPIAPQEKVEANKFDVGVPASELTMDELATVDEDLAELPDGYGMSTIVLMPRDPQWAFVYWDVPGDHKEAMRRQGGQQIALRIYDVTGIDINHQRPHSVQEHACDELAREWYLPLPVSDRDYIAEIG